MLRPRPPAGPILFAGLLALVAVRLLSAGAHSMWLWGVGLLRFVAPVPGWCLWSASAIVLVPPLGRRLASPLGRLGDLARREPRSAWAAWGLVAGALVWFLPDTLHFLGDFQIRSGSVLRDIPLDLVYPQALPLDLLVHVGLKRELAHRFGIDPNLSARLLGSLDAALLALVAAAFARAFELRGAAATVATSVALFGGALCMFTGFGKATAEICVATGAIALFGVEVVRGRSPIFLGLVAATALALHRSAVALLPAVLVAHVLWLRHHAGQGRWRRPDALLGLALPWAGLALLGPRIYALLSGFDVAHHFLTPGVRGGQDLAAVTLAPLHLADVANAIALLAPMALVAAPLPLVLGRRALRAEGLVLLTLVVPALALMLLVRPQQGVFRDLDVFAPSAVALSFAAAWLAGEALASEPRAQWLAAAIVLGAFAPCVTWLVHNHDHARGIERVRSFVLEPPPRSLDERATTWDYLGFQAMGRDRWDQAGEAWRNAADAAPTTRHLTQWGMAEQMLGNLDQARSIYRKALERDSTMGFAWRGLATTSYRLGDYDEARRAAAEVERLGIHAPELADLKRALEAQPRPR